MKNYQTEELDAPIPVPRSVSVAMEDIAATMREGLLAMAVSAGLAVMGSLMEESVTALCGPKGKHDAGRGVVRHGREDGSLTLGGRRVGVRRPRVRSADGATEVPVPAYELFSSTELLGEMAMTKMMAKLSTRRYRAGLEPVGTQVEATARSTSKSAVSRRFVEATETALAELLAGDLSCLDLVVLMVDGVHFAEHLLVVAMGIGIDGAKHPLAVVEGSTENATLVTDLLVGLRDRGLDVTRPLLVVIDGSKALSAAVRAVRPPRHRTLPTAQNPQCGVEIARGAGLDGGQEDACRLPDGQCPRRPGGAGEPGPRPVQVPPRGRRLAARRAGRDPHRHATRRTPHPRPHASHNQPHRVDDRDLPGPLRQRKTLA